MGCGACKMTTRLATVWMESESAFIPKHREGGSDDKHDDEDDDDDAMTMTMTEVLEEHDDELSVSVFAQVHR